MGYLAILAMSRGRRIGFAAVAGVTLVLLLNGLAARWRGGVGHRLAAALRSAALGGVLFLLYLAWEAWRTPVTTTGSADDGPPPPSGAGCSPTCSIPRPPMFYVAVLPHFTDPAQPLLTQTLVLPGCNVAVATLIHAVIVTFASQTRGLFADPVREQRLRRVLAAALARDRAVVPVRDARRMSGDARCGSGQCPQAD